MNNVPLKPERENLPSNLTKTVSREEAAKVLGVKPQDVDVLIKQELLKEVKPGIFNSSDVVGLTSQKSLSVAEEAAQVGVGLQRAIAATLNILRVVAITAFAIGVSYSLIIEGFVMAYSFKPSQVADWVTQKDPSILQALLQPAGLTALGILKYAQPTAYKEVAQTTIINPNDVLTIGRGGSITPTGPLVIPKSSYLQIVSSTLIKNLNAEFLNGKIAGTTTGNLAIIGQVQGLTDGSVENADLAQITDSNKVAGSAVQLSGNGGLTNNSGLSLLTSCSDSELLKWNDTTNVWECSADAGALGAGVTTIREAGATVVSTATGINFDGTDFAVTETPTGIGNIAIDYTNSKVVRSNQVETITGVWSFSGLSSTGTSNIGSGTGVATVNSSGALNLTGASPSTWTLGANSLTLTSSNFNIGSTGVITLAGGQPADITTTTGTSSTALIFQPGTNTTNSGTGALLTLSGGNESGTTSIGGGLTLTGGSGTSTNGNINIGTTNTNTITIGATGITTTNVGALTSTQTLTASNGLTLTTGAINLNGTSGALSLTGLGASSLNTGANNLTFTSGNFNTTATGINGTVIGATTAAAGTFSTLTGLTFVLSTNTSGNILVANGSQFNSVALSGDATINSSGVLTLNYAGAQHASGSLTGFLTSTDWGTFNGKQDFLGFTPENVVNKDTSTALGTSDTKYPSQKAVKSYVDAAATGLVWESPAEAINVIGDAAVPPAPVNLDAYVIDSGGVQGAWSTFAEGDLVQYQTGPGWVLIKHLALNDYFGIAFKSSTIPSGDFSGNKNYIAKVTGGTAANWTYTLTAPTNSHAVYVQNANAYYHDVAYVYSSSLSQWVQLSASASFTFANGLTTSGTTISLGPLTSDWTQSGVFDINTAGDVSINGGDLKTTAASATVFNANATTLNIGGAATTIGLGAAGATVTGGGALTIKSATGTALTIDSGTTGNVNIGNSANAKAIVLGSSTVGTTLALTGGATWSISTVGTLSTTGSVTTTGSGAITSAGLLTASNGLTLSGGAINLTAASGAFALSGLLASSIDTGSNALTITSSIFNTTATGINSTAIGTTTPSTGKFTTLTSTGTSNIGSGTGVVTINSSGAINLTGASPSTWTIGANALTLTASNYSISSAGVHTLAGGQTADITTTAGTTPAALVFQPGNNTTNSGTGASFTLRGGNESGTTSTGGNLVLTAGTGTSTNGTITIGTTNTNAITVGAAGTTFALASNGGLNVTTGGALTGIASLDTISTSATALTFAGAGTISSTTTSAITIDSGSTGNVNLGNGAFAKAITIGNNTGGTAINITSGTGAQTFTSSNVTGTTTSSSFVFNPSAVSTGTGLYLASSTLSSGMLMNLQVSGTAAAASQTALNILTTGATATNGITTYGSQISNTHTNATSGTNIALYLNASGATTANYGLIVNAGNVGIGTTTPSRIVDVVGDWGGNVVTTATTDSGTTSTISTKALAYYVSSTDTTGTCATASKTFNITGLSDTEGSHAYIVSKAIDGGCGPGTLTLTVSINGTTISTVANANTGGTVTENYTVAFINGVWRILGTPSTADGADLAEMYSTNDQSLNSAEVVSLDSSLQSGVKRSTTPYDHSVLGVISTQPSLVMGKVEGITQVPVALIGRVPVNVNTESGPIAAGDALTTSSTPGVAMKAGKAGPIIGMAMNDYNGAGVGQILVFLENGSGLGSSIASLAPGVTGDNVGQAVLNQMLNNNLTQPITANVSDIVTDRVAAGVEVISPKLTVKDISLNGALSLIGVDGTEKVRIDSYGNAVFAGSVKAGSIEAKQILGLEDIVNEFATPSATLITDIQKENPFDPVEIIAARITGGNKLLINLVVARVKAIRGYFDEIFAKKVHTDEVCLSKTDGTEVCITGDQLEKLIPSPTPTVTPVSTPGASPETTPAPSDIPSVAPTASPSASPTETPISSPTPDSTPSPTP